jgi:hypothetical protein
MVSDESNIVAKMAAIGFFNNHGIRLLDTSSDKVIANLKVAD